VHNKASRKRVPVLILTGFLFCSYTASQSIALNYYNTGTGQNLTLDYSHSLRAGEVGIGLGWTINSLVNPDNQGNIFYKRQFATRKVDHLNLNVFYHRYIFQSLEPLDIFLFYDFQAKHSAAMNQLDPTQDERNYHGPYFWLDNTVGFGFNVSILKRLFLQEKIGGGVHLILPSNITVPRINSMTMAKFVWEFIGMLNVGIVYRL
jgi:hypothetical protein